MNDIKQTVRGGTMLPALLIAIGMIIGGWALGAQIKATRLSDRYVTVRGLVERNVKSDLAIWPLSYKEAGDDLSLVYAKTEVDKKRFCNSSTSRASSLRRSNWASSGSSTRKRMNTAA